MSRRGFKVDMGATIDDLRRELAQREGEGTRTRAGLLHRLAWEMRDTDALAAHALAEEALALARALGDVDAEAFALVARAYATVRRAHGADAVEDAQSAEQMFRKSGNAVGLRRALNTLGICYGEASRFMDALETFLALRQICEESGDRSGEADALNSIGIVYVALDDHAAALEYHLRSLGLARDVGDTGAEVRALTNLGSVAYELGRHDEALAYLEESLTRREEGGDPHTQAITLVDVGRCLQKLGRHDEALDVLGRARQLLAGIHPARGVAYAVAAVDSDRADDIGQGHRQLGDTAAATAALTSALAHANHELEVLARSLREADAQKSRLLRQVERHAREDALTGLGNRRHFEREIAEAFPAHRDAQRPFSVALCDLDDFKGVNDSYGHAVGDRVLRAVGRLLKANVRGQDLVARYGGEEFIVMFPDAAGATARGICERMRLAVERFDWAPIAPGLDVTLSFGVASDPSVKHHERLISVADALLGRAKATGKNRVVDDGTPTDLADARIDAPDEIPDTRATGGGGTVPVAAPAVPAGLTLRTHRRPLETVTTQVGSIALLATRPNLEVSEGTLDEGGRMTLVPPEPGQRDPPELYYVLEGRLTSESPDEHFELRAGDHLIVEELEQPVILKAASHVRFLYASPEPSFHHMSWELDQLRKLAVSVESVDGYTAEHCGRIQTIAYAIGQDLGLSKHRLHVLDYAAYLHDVGKVKVPHEILTSSAALTEAEWEIIRRHPQEGAAMLADTFMADAGPIIAQHHERLDGSGYPLGLSGDEIRLEAHIVAVADTFDAMTSNRPYRAALPRETALAELRRLSGRSYPAEVVEAFERVLPNLVL